jgi:hypothetical protein
MECRGEEVFLAGLVSELGTSRDVEGAEVRFGGEEEVAGWGGAGIGYPT